MKKFLPAIVFCLTLLAPYLAGAQTTSFSVQYDTVPVTVVYGSSSVFDRIAIHSASSVTLNWHVINTNFPADWLTGAALGLCDNNVCYQNGPDTHGNSMQLWNDTTHTGDIFTSSPYADTVTAGAFDMALNLAGATTLGTYWLTVSLYPSGSPASSKTMTFLISKPVGTGVPGILQENNVSLYPNPARDELNLVYDASADVKSIAVYNIIGKVMSVYKVTDSNSANLNLENIPSGIYFVRLMNSHGGVVVTRKFTKQ